LLFAAAPRRRRRGRYFAKVDDDDDGDIDHDRKGEKENGRIRICNFDVGSGLSSDSN